MTPPPAPKTPACIAGVDNLFNHMAISVQLSDMQGICSFSAAPSSC
ncbi:hypothetical protein SMB34_07445 [Thalassospira permensis NBRC 106175]|uniref:Uncharacterized protein n=1 Tax=Thalassospira permensis NBRC 106175 TaxID=1353532 RepID=A0ABR4TJH6_9PROT|nr:hypothetical protein SMB34_07445 [Thalassospira permensis NBRC 106175]